MTGVIVVSNPRTNMNGLWPFRPRLVDDETFASWFSRTAWANGLSPTELYPIALPGARMFRIDLDRYACDELINNLYSRTVVPSDDLWPRTLDRWAGHLFEGDDARGKLI